MKRYFLEVAYKGTAYSGFQVQLNANTIQAEVEKALQVFFRHNFSLTGSSRTDAGVHAAQNFFHFDTDTVVEQQHLYNLNSILPGDIAVKNIYSVSPKSHCRFDALSREYKYFIYKEKNPFLKDSAWYYPFAFDFNTLQETAKMLYKYSDFTAFSKRNTQVKSFICSIQHSGWAYENDSLVYTVRANRFLRGMVRGLVSTMLKTARNNISRDDFRLIIENKDSSKADFSAPPHGLCLIKVNYHGGMLP